MEPETYIKGKLKFKEWKEASDDKAVVVAQEFVEKLFYEMTNACLKFYNPDLNMCDMPYMYSERRLDCVIMPALAKICHGLALDEVPTERHYTSKRVKQVKSQGRYDYWCIYEGYSFVIEVKHGYDSFKNAYTVNKKVYASWKTMITQLKSVKKDIKCYIEKTQGVIRLGLMFITSYSDTDPYERLMKKFNRSVKATADYFFSDLGTKVQVPKPDMVLLWKVPEKIINDENRPFRGTFPGFWTIAKVFPSIEHDGAAE